MEYNVSPLSAPIARAVRMVSAACNNIQYAVTKGCLNELSMMTWAGPQLTTIISFTSFFSFILTWKDDWTMKDILCYIALQWKSISSSSTSFCSSSVLTASSTAISSKGFMLCFTPSVTTWQVYEYMDYHPRIAVTVFLPPSYQAWPWSWPHSQSLSCILQALLGPLCLKKLEGNLWKHILQVRRNGKFHRALNRSRGYFIALTFDDQKISLD